MVASIQDDDPSGLAHQIRDVKLMEDVLEIALAMIEIKGDQAIAQHIVACLETRVDENDDGIVVSVAHWSMYWDLLSLAHMVLKRDKEREQSGTPGREIQVIL